MAGVTLEEANAIMAQMCSDKLDENQSATDDGANSDRVAKKPRVSSEVSISGQSDMADTSNTSETASVRIQMVEENSIVGVGNDVPISEDNQKNDESKASNSPVGADPPVENEPDWDQISQHDPARTEVPVFLSTRERREGANHRFAMALDELHDSVSHSIDELVQTVSSLLQARSEKLYEYEQNLKQDYIYNEKMRASMQKKLEESARAAQGYFANLLMRIAQPDDSTNNPGTNADGKESEGGSGKPGSPISRGVPSDEEPDWDAMKLFEPAKSEVPKFLEARDRRANAESRFASAIEEYSSLIDCYFQELTQTVADMYNSRSMKLNEYEQNLKQDYISNDEMRAAMQTKLEQSATLAHNMFQSLMTRVAAGGLARSMPQDAP